MTIIPIATSPIVKGNHTPLGTSKTIPIVVDLCSGLGGISLAAQHLGMRIIAAVDTNSNALLTYKRNFPDTTIIERSIMGTGAVDACMDAIRLQNLTTAPLIVVSGPPCQGFSAAGPRSPSDKRNKVFLAVASAIVRLKPQCALIENVAAVLEDKHAARVQKFKRKLETVGYSVLTLLLDAKDYAVPQRRERVFFLVSRTHLNETEVRLRLDELKTSEVTVSDALRGLPRARLRPEGRDEAEERTEIPNHFAMRHSQEVRCKIALLEPGTGPMSYRKLHPARPANTLFSGHRAPPAHYKSPRSITVREAARLQGFPDTFRIYGSFSNQMEQVTNAVPPPLAETVLRALAEQTGLTVYDHD